MKKEATFSVSVGEVIDLLDLWVADQSGWSEYDSYGTEKKIYKCDGGTVPFYLYVDDDTADYAEVRLSAGWDKDNHIAIGNNTTVQYIVKYACTWRVVGDVDHLVLYAADTITYARGMYAGYTSPILSSDTNSIFIIASNTSSSTSGLVTSHSGDYGYWLFKYGGGTPQAGSLYHPTIGTNLEISINGEGVVLFPPYVVEKPQAYRCRGRQKSIYGNGGHLPAGFSVGDTIYLDELPFVARQVYGGYCWIKNG